jgi:hypothetical protein
MTVYSPSLTISIISISNGEAPESRIGIFVGMKEETSAGIVFGSLTIDYGVLDNL